MEHVLVHFSGEIADVDFVADFSCDSVAADRPVALAAGRLGSGFGFDCFGCLGCWDYLSCWENCVGGCCVNVDCLDFENFSGDFQALDF